MLLLAALSHCLALRSVSLSAGGLVAAGALYVYVAACWPGAAPHCLPLLRQHATGRS